METAVVIREIDKFLSEVENQKGFAYFGIVRTQGLSAKGAESTFNHRWEQFYLYTKSISSSWYFPDAKESAQYNYIDIKVLLLSSPMRYRKDFVDKQALKTLIEL